MRTKVSESRYGHGIFDSYRQHCSRCKSPSWSIQWTPYQFLVVVPPWSVLSTSLESEQLNHKLLDMVYLLPTYLDFSTYLNFSPILQKERLRLERCRQKSKLNFCDGHLKHLTNYAKDGWLLLHFHEAEMLALSFGDLLNSLLLAKYYVKSF